MAFPGYGGVSTLSCVTATATSGSVSPTTIFRIASSDRTFSFAVTRHLNMLSFLRILIALLIV